ncbi:MAG TPA: helix-turn-helix transcriptional regulator [Methylomirabilota bacterium]|jgi:transcriptional regulator with XRE-family HTH domain
MDELATRIRKARVESGLSREHLAARLDVSYKTVVRYETGRSRNISAARLIRIAEATGKPIAWFFEAPA